MKAAIKSSGRYHFYLYTILLTLTLLVIHFIKPSWLYQYVWYIHFFFFIVTLGSINATKYASKILNKNFVQIYFGIMTIRLLICLAFAIIFIIKDREHVLLFGINFMVLYLLFLGFEIYTILTNLRTHFKKGIGND